MTKVTIAIDAMSGDNGIEATVPAALQVLARHPNLELILVGDVEVLKRRIALGTECKKKGPEQSCCIVNSGSKLPERLTLYPA